MLEKFVGFFRALQFVCTRSNYFLEKEWKSRHMTFNPGSDIWETGDRLQSSLLSLFVFSSEKIAMWAKFPRS